MVIREAKSELSIFNGRLAFLCVNVSMGTFPIDM